MSLDCLDNIIGIDKVCTPDNSISGLDIGMLPGISIKALDSAANSEIKNAQEFFNEKIKLAKLVIRNRIESHFSDKIVHESLVEHETLGYWTDNLQLVSKEAGKLKGIQLEIDRSAYTELYVESIWLQLKEAITIDIEIYDIISGTKLDTIPITTVANVPTQVEVNKSYRSNKQKLNLIAVIDSSVSDTYKTTLTEGRGQCVDCNNGFGFRNNVLRARGIEILSGAVKTLNNLKASRSSTNGMSIAYSVQCSIDNFICLYNKALALPLLYLVGSLIMDEIKHSDRYNTFITIRKAKNEELQEEYEFKYREALDNLLENMILPDNDCCFRCGSKIKQIQRIP